MPWNPTKRLSNLKRQQFRFTDAANNQGFFLHPIDDGLDIQLLLEHVHFFPDAVANVALNGVQKAHQYNTTLTPPANVIFARVLFEQENGGETELDEFLNSYILERMGEHGKSSCLQAT